MPQVAQNARAARWAMRRARPPRRPQARQRSLSAKDSTTMSPGGWPRSTGVDDLVEGGAGGGEEMHRLSAPGARDAGAIEPLEADHDEVAAPRLGRRPGRSYWWVTRAPTAWTRSRIGLPATAAKPLTRRTPWRSASRCDALRQAPPGRRSPDSAHDEALEVVVVVAVLVVVTGAAVLDVVLGADAEAEQRGRIDLAAGCGDDLDGAGQHAGRSPRAPPAAPAASMRSRLLSTTRSAQASWSSNTSSTGSS